MKGERNPRGAAWRFCLPSPVHFPPTRPEVSQKDLYRRINDFIFTPSFHVWGRHSWALAPNEGLRACLMGALYECTKYARRGIFAQKLGLVRTCLTDTARQLQSIHSTGSCFTVLSGETATLARVLRATDAYSIAWGKFYLHSLFASTTTSRSQSHRLKAAEANLSVLQEMRKGSGVSMLRFEVFWDFYPRKVGKIKAEKNWRKLDDRERRLCMHGLLLWKQTVQWQGNGGMYIPYASTFLAQRRWEEEPWTGAFSER